MLKIIEMLILGIIAFGSLGWQLRLIGNDDWSDIPKRMVPPLMIGTLILLGAGALALLTVFDHNKSDVARSNAWGDVGRSFVFLIVMTGKSWLGPVVLGISAASLAYYGFEYGEMRWFPFISSLLDWLFGRLPEWLEIAYVTISLIYLGWTAVEGVLEA